MSIPTVSVVVATYNYGQYLAQALDSICAQSFTDWEAIVVDDGSTDDTQAVMEPYLNDVRFKYIRTEHVGQPVAKNTGIRVARGIYIAFLDADDAWLPEKLALQVERMDRGPAIGVVYGRRQWIDSVGRPLQRSERVMRRGNVLPFMFRDNFVCFSSAMVRREAFEQCGVFNEQIPLAIDYDLWLRIAAGWKFDYVDEPVVLYRTGHANLSRRGEERLRVALGIMQRFLDEHGNREVLPSSVVRQAFAATYCSLGLVQRDRSIWRSLKSYSQAVKYQPLDLSSYRGILAALLPERARRNVRRALGRPQAWTMVSHCTADCTTQLPGTHADLRDA